MTNACESCLCRVIDPYETPCGHVFCCTCIHSKLDLFHVCPKCKRKVLIDQLRPLERDIPRVLQLNNQRIQNVSLPNCNFTKELGVTVTHAVLDEVSRGWVENTKKYRMCVIYGLAIANPQWLLDSRQKGYLLPISSHYQIRGDIEHQSSSAALKAQETKREKRANIFKGIEVSLIGDLSNEIRNYLEPSLAIIRDEHLDLIVCDAKMDIQSISSKFPAKRLISANWILESICQYQLLPKEAYTLTAKLSNLQSDVAIDEQELTKLNVTSPAGPSESHLVVYKYNEANSPEIFRYIDVNPAFIRSIVSVAPDGNCGFRAASYAMFNSDQSRWFEVKQRMLDQYLRYRETLYHSGNQRDDTDMIMRLQSSKSPCLEEGDEVLWFDTVDCPQIVSDAFRRPVYIYSQEQYANEEIPSLISTMYVPLLEMDESDAHNPIPLLLHNQHYYYIEFIKTVNNKFDKHFRSPPLNLTHKQTISEYPEICQVDFEPLCQIR